MTAKRKQLTPEWIILAHLIPARTPKHWRLETINRPPGASTMYNDQAFCRPNRWRAATFQRKALVALLLATLCLASTAQPVVAQEILTGTVTNAATGRNLEGARLILQETGREVLTDSDGTYRFTNVAPGERLTLSVSYTGLDTVTIPVQIVAGGPNRRDVGLTAEIYKMSAFTVSGEREGNALAITLQRQSDGIKSIVSTDVFGPLAGNPMELLARMPGVEAESVGGELRQLRIRGMDSKLNTVTMDGNRIADANIGGQLTGGSREVQFQGIGSDTFERLELVKSPTPDMDADSIGGAVNLVSKNAFERSPERRLSGSFGVNSRLTDERDSFHRTYSFSYSEVFGGKLGVAFNYSRRPTTSLYELTQQAHEPVPNGVTKPRYTNNFQIKDNEQKRTRWGGGVRLDYKLNDSSRFFINANSQKHKELGHSVHTLWSTAPANIIPGYTENVTEWRSANNSQVTLRTETRERMAETLHLQLGGVHQFKGWKIDYDGFKSKSTVTSRPPVMNAEFIARGIGMRIERKDERTKPVITQISGPDMTALSSYTDNNYNVLVDNIGIDEYTGFSLNAKKEFETVVPTYIKAGVRNRRQSRDMVNSRVRRKYVGPDQVVGVNPATVINDDNLSQFALSSYDNLIFDGRYPKMPYPALPYRDEPGSAGRFSTGPNFETVLRTNPEYFREDVAFTTMDKLQGDRWAREEISAAYIMGNVNLGRLTILAGVRVEQTEVEGEGSKNEITPEEEARRAAWVGPLTNAEIIRRTTAQYSGRQYASGKYRGVFPGIHFKYAPVNDLIFRLSYATNIGRPSFAQLIPSTTVNYDNETVFTSNPSLKPQYADNFDLSAEYYFEPVGMVSVGIFYKELKDFIYTLGGQTIASGSNNGFDGQYAGFLLTTEANGGFAKLKGFELNYNQQFTFLPGWLSGFGAFANYTRVDIEGNYGTGSAISLAPTDEVAGFKPETANAGISYIRNKLTVRLKYNYTGRGLRTFNATRSQRIYDARRNVLDINMAYSFSKNIDVYLDVQNVLGEADRKREFHGGLPQQYIWLDPLFFAGINWRL